MATRPEEAEEPKPGHFSVPKKMVTRRQAEQAEIENIEIRRIVVAVGMNKVIAQTNHGGIVVFEGDAFPADGAVSISAVQAKIEADVAADTVKFN